MSELIDCIGNYGLAIQQACWNEINK